MKDTLQKLHNSIQRRSRYRTIVMSLAVVVVFVTTYLLILPAITLDQNEAERQGGIDVPAVTQTADTDTDTATAISDNSEHEETTADIEAEDKSDREDDSETSIDADQTNSEDSDKDTDTVESADGASTQSPDNQEDTSGVMEEENAEAEASKGSYETDYLASDGNNYRITVTYGEDAGVPEGAELSVHEITAESKRDDDAYDEYVRKTEEALGWEEGSAFYVRLFDIKIVDEDGNKVEIEAPVDVKIELKDKEEDQDTQVVHFADGKTKGDVVEHVEVKETSEKKSESFTLAFEADGFSVYAIVDGPSPVPVGWGRVTSVQEAIEQGSEENGGLYIGNPGGYYFRNTTETTTNNGTNRTGIQKTKPDTTYPPTTEGETTGVAAKYYFELVEGTTNKIYAYCYDGTTKKYVYHGPENNSLSLTTDASTRTAFTINVENGGKFVVSDGSWYWNMQGSANGSRFCSWNANNDDSKLYLWYKTESGNDPLGLDGQTYSLLTWDKGKTGKALTGSENGDVSGNLSADFLTVMTNKNNYNLKLFVPNSSAEKVTPWTFHWDHDDYYKMSAVVYGRDAEGRQIVIGTKYLKIDSSGLHMVDTEEEATAIQVIPGTGIHAGQIMLKSGGNVLTYSGTFAEGYDINSGAGKEFLYLSEARSEEELKDYFRTYTATKISVSDPSLSPQHEGDEPKEIIIYTRVWNGSSYEYFAIDGDGKLVPCFESGDEIEWIGSGLNELQWEFTEYGEWKDGSFKPNNYYELQNALTDKYLAPLISANQILSDSPIGLNMNGRRNGQYYTPVLSWDEANYSFASIKADLDASGDASIEPCYRIDGMDIYFAIVNELDKDDQVHTVPTVDNNMYGITMKLADYGPGVPGDKAIKASGCTTTQSQTNVLVHNSYDAQHPQQQESGLLSTNLDSNGYPTATRSGKSLGELYTNAKEVNHLFVESTYKATGYYEYDSAQNFASLQGRDSGDFVVYQELGTYDPSDKWTLKHGQFLPYNDLKPGHFAVKNNRNQYTPTGPLDTDDPRYNEQLYLVDNVNNYFGIELTAGFYQTPSGLDAWGHDIIFEFSGDDDFWLYVDGELVIDLGGIHSAVPGSVNFRTGEVNVNGDEKSLRQVFIDNYLARGMSEEEAIKIADGDPSNPERYPGIFATKYDPALGKNVTTFKDNTSHKMRIFYMERGAGASNLNMRFNLAAVRKGTVQLKKELDVNDVDMSSSVYAAFPYQIFYKNPLTDKYEQLTEETLGNKGSVKYVGSTNEVAYKKSLYIDNTNPDGVDCSVKYDGVYLVKPDETIEIAFPVFGETGSEKYVEEYKVVECGVDPLIYDKVTLDDGTILTGTQINTDIKVVERDEHGDPTQIVNIPEVYSGLCDYAIDYDSLDNRSRVNYKNNTKETQELLLQKNLYKKEGGATPELIPASVYYDDDGKPINPDNPDLKTTYDFRVSFKTPIDAEYNPANVYDYHVKDPGGYYCRWHSVEGSGTDPNEEGNQGYFERITDPERYPNGTKDFNDLTYDTTISGEVVHGDKFWATFNTSQNGAISHIPAYYTVEVRGLIPGTQYKVVERPDETPDGYEFYRYERDGVPIYPSGGDPLNGVEGKIIKDDGAVDKASRVLIDNYKGHGLHLYKTWSDASTMKDRDPAYFAVYYENTNDAGGQSRILIDGSVRQLPYSADPQELYWFYLHLPDVEGVTDESFDNYIVREVTLTGDIVVDEDGVVSNYDTITVVENGGIMTLYGTTTEEGAVRKEIPYKVTYTDPQTVGTSLRKFKVTNTPSDKPAVKFLKEDWATHALSGATFRLSQGSTQIFEKTSSSDGLISIDHLSEYKDYVIKEIITPQGYYGLQEPLTFQLVADETTGWTLDVTPDTGDITKYYKVGFEQVKNDHGVVIAEYVTLTIKDCPYVFQAIKVDGTDNSNKLAGVKFNLHRQEKVGQDTRWVGPLNWDGVSDLITDNNGVIPHVDSDLTPGTYQLREVDPAAGYAGIGNIDFTITQMGVITLGTTHPDDVTLEGPTEGTGEFIGKLVYTLTIPNDPIPLKLKKVDETGNNPLTGSKFELCKKDEEHSTSTHIYWDLVTDIDMTTVSEINISSLAPGDYRLEEKNAPEGYVLLDKYVYFRIKSDRTVKLLEDDGKTETGDTYGYAKLSGNKKNGFMIAVKNVPGTELPASGGIGTTIFYVFGSILFFGCAIVLIARKRASR